MRRCERNQQGFTLMELMAAVLITVVIVAATMTMVVTSNRANVVNTQVADTQQNVRLATDLLSRDIKLAGASVGCMLASRIEQDSGGALSFNFASLYATLYKLEGRGWIQGRWVERAGQRRRRYYRLTAAGTAVLGRQREEWTQFVLALGRLTGLRFA